MSADVKLVFGAHESSVGQISKDLKEMLSKLDSSPIKIKVGVILDNESEKKLRSQISNIYNSTSSSGSKTSQNYANNSGRIFASATDNAHQYSLALRQVNTLLSQTQHNIGRWGAAEHGRTSESFSKLKEYATDLETLRTRLLNNTITIKEYSKQISILRKNISTVSTDIKLTGKNTQTLTQRMGGLAEKFGTWFSITRVVMAAYRTIRQMVTNVIELDTAMTELRKVTNETSDTYDRFLTKATSRAKELGATITDIVSASADFARLGFGIEDAEKLADAAIVYKNVGDGIDINTATESIIATMQAFHIPAEEAMKIVDRFNEVGNNFAISSKGVGDALMRSAAALHSANNTLDESIALSAAANTIVQDPEKVGTTLKTVAMYLRAAKTEAEDAGEETTGMAGSVSELRKEILALTANKVDIQADKDSFKSTYQILKELSEVWGSLTDIAQANILEMIGGKRNANVVAALLEDFSIAEDVLKTSADSAGSALAENEKYLDSIQGHISIMKASFEELSNTFINSEFVKSIIDFITLIIEGLNWVGKLISALGGLNTVLYTTASILLVINIETIIGKLSKLSGIITSITGLIEKLNSALTVYKAMNAAQKNPAAGAMVVSGQSTSALSKLSVALKTAGISLSSLQLAIGGFLALLPIVIGLIDLCTVSLSEQREKLEESKKEYQNIASEIKSVNDELSTTNKRISELESKDKLTFTEADELENLRKQSTELQRQNDLLEAQAIIQRKKVNKNFIKTMEADAGKIEYTSGNTKRKETRGGRTQEVSVADMTEKEYAFSQIDSLSKLYAEKENATTKKQIDAIDKRIEKVNKYLQDKNAQWQKDYEGVEYIQNPTSADDKKVNEWLDYINNFQDKMSIALGGKNAKENAFNRLVDNWKFDGALQGLQDLGKQGKVTGQILKEKMGDPVFADFVDTLQRIGFISDDSIESLQYLAGAFNGVGQSAKQYVKSLNNKNIVAFTENLANEAKMLGTTKEALSELVAEHILFNQTGISTENKQAAFVALANAIGKTSDEVIYLIKLLNAASDGVTLNLSDTMEPFANVGNGRKVSVLGDIQVDPLKILKDRYGIGKEIVIPEKDKTKIPNTPVTDSKSSKDNFDDSYYSTIEAMIEDEKKAIKLFEEDKTELNRQYEHALDIGNKEQSEILRNKLAENIKTQKDVLHQQNESRRALMSELLSSLYTYAPSLAGKSWDEISDVDLTNVENSLNNISETASDKAKNQAKYNLNQFKGIVEDLKTLDKAIEENSESWRSLDDDAKNYWKSQIDFQEDYSRGWIEKQKHFDKLSEEEELAAYDRMINNNKVFQEQIINDMSLSSEAKVALIKETNDRIVDIEKDAYDLRKDIFDNATDHLSSYNDSKSTLLQSYFDVINSVAEAQHEINKELETSKTMYEWLDEDTRKLLFNQEDYNVLCKELIDIQSEADRLQRQFEYDIENSTLNTIEEITSNYEMQYDMLMKSYEIAKADLEVAKKKQKLNNVLNERNVRMFINGQWQWVANTQDVIDAKSELADAEYARKTAVIEQRQTESLNELTAKQDKLGTVISEFESSVIDLDNACYKITEIFGTLPSAIETAISRISSSSVRNSSSNSSGSSSGGYSGSSSNKTTTAWVPGLGDVGVTTKNGRVQNSLPVGSIVHTNGGNYKIIGGTPGNYTSVKVVEDRYADGTRHTINGNVLMGEKGLELFLSANGQLIPITRPTIANVDAGGVVFNKEQLDSARAIWDLSNIGKSKIPNLIQSASQHSTGDTNCNNVIINGMTVDSGSSDGQALISALRRYVSTH